MHTKFNLYITDYFTCKKTCFNQSSESFFKRKMVVEMVNFIWVNHLQINYANNTYNRRTHQINTSPLPLDFCFPLIQLQRWWLWRHYLVCPTLEFIDVCLTFVLAFRHTFTCTFPKGKMFLPHSPTADCDDSPSLAKAFTYAQRPPHTLFQLWVDCYRSNKSSVVFFGIFKTAIIQKVNISTNDLVMIFQMQKDEDPTFFVTV